MLIEASITAGIRPTSMILGTQPTKRWNEFDFLCLEAYQIVQRERCQQCGLPVWICHNEDGDIGFGVVEDTCFGVREVETTDEKKSSKANYKAPKGVKTRPEPFRYSKGPLDLATREAYYRAAWERDHPET